MCAPTFYAFAFVLCSSASLTVALRCHQRNQYQSWDDPYEYTCATSGGTTTGSQCFKFVCMGTSSSTNPFYVQKGCLDSTNSGTATCTNLIAQCQGVGGGATGTCYTCSNDGCNGAEVVQKSPVLLLLPIALYALVGRLS